MALMEKMRSGTDSTLMQVVLALVVVSFVFWYATPQGDMASIIATVNGEQILDTEFFQRYRSEERRRGGNLNDTQREQLRNEVKQDLIQEEVILQEAQALGLSVSDTEVARLLRSMEVLKKDGKFNEERYQSWLRSQRMTRPYWEGYLRRDLLRQKLRVLVYQGASISEPVLKEAFVRDSTRIDLEYVRIRPSQVASEIEVADEDVATFLEEDGDRVQAAYDRDFKRLYDVPEKVLLHVVRLEKKDDGEDEAARLAAIRAELSAVPSGTAWTDHWATVAARWSEDGSVVNGGEMGKLALTTLSKDVVEALTDLELGALSPTVETSKDLRIFAVSAREEGRIIELEEVREDIAKRLLREDRSPVYAKAFAQDLADAWLASGQLDELSLQSKGLRSSNTGPISLTGEGSPFPPPDSMLKAAEGAGVGDVLPGVYEADGVLWVGKLSDRRAADMTLYETEKTLVREQVLNQRRMAFYQNWVQDAVARADIQ